MVGGLLGTWLDSNPNFFLPGGFLGAVTGGVVAAGFSDHGVLQDTINAGIADVVSSLGFFALVYVGFLSIYTRPVEVVGFSILYLAFGSAVAIPIATISFVIASVVGLLTTWLQWRIRSQSLDDDRS